MPRATTKKELILSAKTNYKKLLEVIDSLTKKELETEFDFSKDKSKKEMHWKRDKNLRDILVHLYEWHQLLINWITSNQKGQDKSFLPEPYNWKTYGDMNIEFWKKHQKTSLAESKKKVDASHKEALKLIDKFTDKELFTKSMFKWTGTSTLGSYCISATASHYDWAIKKLKAHIKNCK